MKILVFDTESSGFPSNALPAYHFKQASIIQLAAILFDSDTREEADTLYSLIKLEDNKAMEPGAEAQHGISKEKCQQEGKEAVDVINEFLLLVEQADIIVCHNVAFDSRMLDIELAKLRYNGIVKKWICTMEVMTPLCKLSHKNPKRTFGQSYKWPKLHEAYSFIFGVQPPNQHDALGDVKATKKIFQWLIDKNHLVLPITSSTDNKDGIKTAIPNVTHQI